MAGPIILSNISVPLLGAVDTAVMGHLSAPYYIGAVALGAMIFNFIFHGFNCLRMGTTGPTAQASGAGDAAEVRAMLGRSLILAAVISACLLALQMPIAWFAFLAIDASPEVESFGETYFLIRVWGTPASLAGFAIIGWFYGLSDARIPLVLQLFTNGLNMALDFLFVFAFGWDVAGVAAATVIAEYAGLALAVVLIVRRLRTLPRGEHAVRILDGARLRRMIAINRDIFIRTMCVVSTLAVFMAKSAALGDVTLAANQVLYNFLAFTSYGLDGFAFAAEAMIGQAVGRGERHEFRRAVRVVFLWAAAGAAVNVLIYWAAGGAVIALLTSIPEVRQAAHAFLPWAVLMPAISVWAFTYDGIYLGVTRTRIMRNTMIIAFAAFLAGVYLLPQSMGNHGLWLAIALFMGFRGTGLMLAYPKLAREVG
jgi:MATE family multidrug resistance protein